MLLVGQRLSVHAKALAIENALGIASFDPPWTLPSLPERTPLVWMAEVNGLPVDFRDMSRNVQEIAFGDGLIPYNSGGSAKPIVNEMGPS
jgi:hypothetical protein